jgi:uncharacterized RDD family membrane protein YckC
MKKKYATYTLRFLASVIDLLIIFLLFKLSKDIFFGGQFTPGKEVSLFLILLLFTVGLLSMFEYFFHATPGKLVFRLKVLRTNSRECTLRILLIRNAIKIFTLVYFFLFLFGFSNVNSILVLGIVLSVSTNAVWHDFMILTKVEDHNHELVHDEVARTTVIVQK